MHCSCRAEPLGNGQFDSQMKRLLLDGAVFDVSFFFDFFFFRASV
jgi:hypothetical protein